jgi:hypothetical protein
MSSHPNASGRRSIALGALAFLLYVATLTGTYYPDGITFSLQIERFSESGGRWAPLFHQNHLLYSAVGYLIYEVAHALGVGLRALYILQITNCAFGALSIALFYRIVLRQTASAKISTATSIGFAIAAGWWKMSTDADAYVISVFLILVCLNFLLAARSQELLAGLALSGAMLMHELAALFFLAALSLLLLQSSRKRKLVASTVFTLAAWMPTLAAYWVVSRATGIEGTKGAVEWALSTESGARLAFNPTRGFLLLPKANLDLIVGHSFALFWHQLRWVELLLAAVALVLLVAATVVAIRRFERTRAAKAFKSIRLGAGLVARAPGEHRVALMLFVWICVYLVFFLFWEPWQFYYRVFYLPALAMLAGLLLSNHPSRDARQPADTNLQPLTRTKVALMFLLGLGAFNLAFYILPNTYSSSDRIVEAAKSASSLWDENTSIYFLRRNEADTAFEYFNPRARWQRLGLENRRVIEDRLLSSLERGERVWINRSVIDALDRGWIAAHASGRDIEANAPNEPAHYLELSKL